MRLLLAAVAFLVLVRPAVAQADTASSTRYGVYTEPQARRGEAVYSQTCARCHLPEFFQEQVLPSWVGAPVSLLFDVIRTRMPEDRPGGLAPQQYADVLAYIFELNGIPPGRRELPSELERLGRILIERSQ